MLRFTVLALAASLAAAPAVRADELAVGNWKLTTLSVNGATASSNWLLKVERGGGKVKATLEAANPAFKQVTLKSFTVEDDTVRAVFAYGLAEQAFTGRISKDGKKVVGIYGTEDFPNPAWMTPTEETEIDKTKIVQPAGEAGAGSAALFKLRTAKKGVAEADLAEWATTASKDAGQYGAIWERYTETTIATVLFRLGSQPKLAFQHAQKAERTLAPTAGPAQQLKVLELIGQTARAAGEPKVSDIAMKEVARLDAILDKEYITQGLPFKPAVYEGRKKDGKRVVVLELLTGAQCPPCAAAAPAFDGLLKTYKPSEVALIQYHEHIPGPDPLTNAETEARWTHYRQAFAPTGVKLGGVPTAIINGHKERVGGGPREFAGKTSDAYRGRIDALLEEPATCQIKLSAGRKDDRVDVEASVAGLDPDRPNCYLRVVLVEEVVHYGGGNKVRMHHHVVRAMPGGVGGKQLTPKDASLIASVNLTSLRKTFTTYLDDFVAT